MQKNFLNQLLRSPGTVFSFKELLLRFKDEEKSGLKAKLNYYIKKGELYHIRKGLYAKDAHYKTNRGHNFYLL